MKRLRAAAGLVCAGLSAGVLVLAGAPQAAAELSYEASAEAFAFRSTLANQSLPLGLTLEGQGPVSRARQTSLSQSDAFAAFPYPGDTAAQGPGVVGGLIGVPLPGYPLQASTTFGDKPAVTQLPGVDLRAESAQQLTQASALLGSGGSGAATTSRIIQTGAGAIEVSAVATGDALDLAGVVALSAVRASAIAMMSEAGELTRATELSIGRIAVPGLRLTIPPNAPALPAAPEPIPAPPAFPPVPLPFGGQTIDAPEIAFRNGQFGVTLPGLGSQVYAVPSAAVAEALAGAGVTMTYQAAQQTDDGVISPAISFSTVLPEPPPSPAGISGTSTLTVTFGLAQATIAAAGTGAGEVPAAAAGAAPGQGLPAGSSVDSIGVIPHSTAGVVPTGGELVGSGQNVAFLPAGELALLRDASSADIAWVFPVFVGAALACAAAALALLNGRSTS